MPRSSSPCAGELEVFDPAHNHIKTADDNTPHLHRKTAVGNDLALAAAVDDDTELHVEPVGPVVRAWVAVAFTQALQRAICGDVALGEDRQPGMKTAVAASLDESCLIVRPLDTQVEAVPLAEFRWGNTGAAKKCHATRRVDFEVKQLVQRRVGTFPSRDRKTAAHTASSVCVWIAVTGIGQLGVDPEFETVEEPLSKLPCITFLPHLAR